MQIRFNDVLLAGEWKQSTSEMSREAATMVQEIDFLRGTEPQWQNRGNYKSTLSFSSMRQFSSIMEAELFFLEHGDNEGTKTNTNLVGIVEFICGDSPSASRYARGKLSISMPKPIGVSITATYRIEYGRLLVKKPTS